ncbi:MAG: ABC transporter permease [Ruminococcus sp.]|nr:ABC transporter permease [Ruminococcus sp.]
MQVFKVFFKVLKKKYKTALIYTIIFLAISYGLSNSNTRGTEFKESTLNVAVMDDDGTEQSKALTDFIDKKHEIKSVDNDEQTMTELLYWENVDYILVINKGFEDALAQGRTEGLFKEYRVHDSFSSVYMTNILNEYVKTVEAYSAAGLSLGEAASKTSEVLSRSTDVTYLSDVAEGSEEYSLWFSHYFQYMPYILISVLLSVLGVVLGSLNKKAIRYRTECSAVSARKITMQIYAGAGVFVLVMWLIFMVAGAVMKGGIYEGKAWLAVLNSFVFTLVAASIAILVSSLDLEENVTTLVTQVLGLGMSFICGVFVPLSLLSDGVILAARFLPAYWYIRANNMLNGSETYDAGKFAGCIGIQLAFAAVLLIFTLVVKRAKSSETVN